MAPLFTLPDAAPLMGEFSCLTGGRIVWGDGMRRLRSSGLPAPQQVESAFEPVTAEIEGAIWIAYNTQNDRLLLHRLEDASRGFVLATVPAYGVRMRSAGPGLIEACWFGNPGEIGPATRARVTIADAQPFSAAAVDVPSVGRAVWAGWYAFLDAPIDPQGNCGLYVGPGQDGYLRTSDGRPIAQYAAAQHDSDVDELDARIQALQASDPAVPALAYWTLQAQGIRLPNAPIVGVEAYCKTVETLTGFEARVRNTVRRVPRAWLIAQCYTSNASNTSDLAALVPIYARILRDCRNVEGVLVFSGNGRATGYQDHPEVQSLWRALFASIDVPDLGTVIPDPGTPAEPPAAPDPIIGAPDPEPASPFPGELMNITTGRYDIEERADSTLKITRVTGAGGAAPAVDYASYHAGLERVTAARAARGQGPNLDIDAYWLIVDHHGDADALIARNNAEPA
jgi:hypothetical protein